MNRRGRLGGTNCHPKQTASFMPYLDEFCDRYLEVDETVMTPVAELYFHYRRWAKLYSDGEPNVLSLIKSRTRFSKWLAIIARNKRYKYCTFGRRSYGVLCRLPERILRKSIFLCEDEHPFEEHDLVGRATSYVAQTYQEKVSSLPFKRVFIDKNTGDGAVASRHIRKREIVCEYFGLLITSEEANEREELYQNNKQPSTVYKFRVDEHKSIFFDGSYDHIGNFLGMENNHGAWLNQKIDEANCEIKSVEFEGKHRLVVVAKYRIHKGTELLQYCGHK
ncbi:uncharacterized protein [Ptychodera flava]|uniref:uncharacterized protein n=1 Tax=Ptychodera flava TaxID=63121 RepID=UPI00396A29BD